MSRLPFPDLANNQFSEDVKARTLKKVRNISNMQIDFKSLPVTDLNGISGVDLKNQGIKMEDFRNLTSTTVVS